MVHFWLNRVDLQISSDHFFSCGILWYIWYNSINISLRIEFIFSLKSNRLLNNIASQRITCYLSCPSRYQWLVRFRLHIIRCRVWCRFISPHFWSLCWGFWVKFLTSHFSIDSSPFETRFQLTRVCFTRFRPIWWKSLPFLLFRCKKLFSLSFWLFWSVCIMSSSSRSWHFLNWFVLYLPVIGVTAFLLGLYIWRIREKWVPKFYH